MTGLAPQWRELAVDWVVDHPMSLAGRVAALRYGVPRGPLPPIVTADDKAKRALVAPANYAGQARAWCGALRASGPDVSAQNYAVSSPYGFDADAVIPPAVFYNSRRWQHAQLDAARGFTHFLAESFIPPFGRLLGRDAERQFAALGPDVDLAYMCHGSDVRRPSLNRERTPQSPFTDARISRRLEVLALRNLHILARSDRPVFVSTPDLLDDVPRARWCPVVVDTAAWARQRPPRSGAPRVVHVPSKAAAKGTVHIEPVLHRLAARGIIEYTPLRGVPHDRMPETLASADIVVDQLSVGSYGVAACEAMAAGCVVIGHATARVRSIVQEQSGLALPLAEADASTLESVILRLAADAGERSEQVERGRQYVTAVHGGARSAQILRRGWIDVR